MALQSEMKWRKANNYNVEKLRGASVCVYETNSLTMEFGDG
jgi:hypothetical protein